MKLKMVKMLEGRGKNEKESEHYSDAFWSPEKNRKSKLLAELSATK